MKIMVTGIGGVGGYLGGVLAYYYPGEVTLIARNKRKESLLKNGLVLHSDFFGEHVLHPAVTDKPEGTGIQDIIFVCVKNYSLPAALTAVLPCIGPDTAVVLVQNGVDHRRAAQKIMTQGQIVDSAIYITSSYLADYSIRQEGRFTFLYVGSKNAAAAQKVYAVINHPGITAYLSNDIDVDIWRKYILNCAYNVITAYYQGSIGKALSQPQGKEEFRTLLNEAYQVGIAAGVHLPPSTVDDQYNRIIKDKNDMDATSSLERDLAAGRQSELDTFSGVLVRLAKAYQVPVPLSEKCYRALLKR